MSDKPLPPTEKRIQDAREEGQVPHSRDALSLAVLLTCFELIFITEALWRSWLERNILLAIEVTRLPFLSALKIMGPDFTLIFFVLSFTITLAAFISALIGMWSSVGFVYAHKIFTKGFDKVNPANNLKNLVSSHTWLEFLMSIIKGGILGTLAYVLIKSFLAEIVLFPNHDLMFVWQEMLTMIKLLIRLILGIFVFIVLLDVKLKKAVLMKQLRMGHDEVKREQKDMMGDPQIKQERRRIGMEMLNEEPKNLSKGAEDANAVVVNPEHFAVGLFFDGMSAPVPMVVFKGVDEEAMELIQSARQHGIPVIRYRWLARTLFATAKPDKMIPKNTFKAVALIYRIVEELEEAQADTSQIIELEDDEDEDGELLSSD